MVLPELFVAVVVAGISAINAAIPAAAWNRSRDGRFLLLASANLVLAALGTVWAWGELPPLHPPSWATPALPTELILLVGAVLLLATTVWPRRA